MAINAEKLYGLAAQNLKAVCYGYAKECNMGPGEDFYNAVLKGGEKFVRVFPGAVADAWEIYSMVREDVLKSKGGTAYTALKRLLKNVGKYRSDMNGYWWDAEGRQCFCDGYRAVRLFPDHAVQGFEEVSGIDLDPIIKEDEEYTDLPLPTPGELKACIAEQKGKDRKFYDFDEDLPRVDANYLKDVMDILPGAKAKHCGLMKGIIFKSEVGDGILLPVRKIA